MGGGGDEYTTGGPGQAWGRHPFAIEEQLDGAGEDGMKQASEDENFPQPATSVTIF